MEYELVVHSGVVRYFQEEEGCRELRLYTVDLQNGGALVSANREQYNPTAMIAPMATMAPTAPTAPPCFDYSPNTLAKLIVFNVLD